MNEPMLKTEPAPISSAEFFDRSRARLDFEVPPGLIDPNDPVLGMAQNYLICPNNHSAPILTDLIMDLCRKYEVDGMVIHASRTCRAWTNPQFLIADAAHKRLGIQTAMFEGDVTDESFYKDELVNTRVEAMLEAIDARRIAAA